ncbi:MAG: TlpA family protein disulfide reductase [Lachnospiraceae bacterium]|nr:TlpA family protein disulfide reductase [Lachnospiraceae bacterium]
MDKGDIAPDFTVELVDGGTFTLSDHDDGIVIVNFWATWCGPCVGEMPGFEELYNEGIEKLSIIGINCAEDRDTVDKFVSKKGFTFPIAYDTDYTVGNYYPSDYIPYTVIVKHGIIEEIIVGAPGDAYTEYKDAVESLMD